MFVSCFAVEYLIVAAEYLFVSCFTGGVFVCCDGVFVCVVFYGGVFNEPVLNIQYYYIAGSQITPPHDDLHEC